MAAHSRWLQSITLAAGLLVAAAPAHAQKHWAGVMKGTNEVPANPSPAIGWTDVFLNGNLLTVNVIWQGLVGGNPAAAHIHCCVAPGSNVGVAVGFTGFPATTSGTYFGTFDLTNAAVYTSSFLNNFGGGTAAGAEAALISGLDAGNAYSNIHNAVYPGGEIRALLVATPEPASMVLMASGLIAFAGVGFVRRRGA